MKNLKKGNEFVDDLRTARKSVFSTISITAYSTTSEGKEGTEWCINEMGTKSKPFRLAVFVDGVMIGKKIFKTYDEAEKEKDGFFLDLIAKLSRKTKYKS